jgi:tetratricopeptide (TPR) repeat protein
LEGEANSYVIIANVYTKLNDTDRALLYFEKALEISESTGNLEFISNILSNVSTVYLSKKEVTKAIGALDRSLKIRRKMGDRKGIASTLTKLGGVYTETKQYGKALSSLREALKISKEIGVMEEEMAATFNLMSKLGVNNIADLISFARKTTSPANTTCNLPSGEKEM